jgi:hypothetical protein
MKFKGYELPTFLGDLPPPADRGHLESAEHSYAKPSRGRPRKPGWMRVEQLIREMHAANPAMPLGTLAFDACKQAAAEYPKRDLPSWETVLRNMKAILAESDRARAPSRDGSAGLVESYGREGSAGQISVEAKSLPLNSEGRSRASE